MPPTVEILAPASVTVGKPFAVAWVSRYADSCTLGGGAPGWPQADAGASGVKSQTISTPGSVLYEVRCTGPRGRGSTTETVRATAVPTFPPAVRLEVPARVPRGKPFTLSWSAANAEFCSLNGGGPGWAQELAGPAGSKTQAILTTATYVVSCTGPSGTRTVRKTVEIAPVAPPPEVLLYLPVSVVVGQGFTVSWTATHAKSCSLEGGASGWRQSRTATFGSRKQIAWVPGSVVYLITCFGPGGTRTVTASVTVTAPLVPLRRFW
jgi:hypothetical protein